MSAAQLRASTSVILPSTLRRLHAYTTIIYNAMLNVRFLVDNDAH